MTRERRFFVPSLDARAIELGPDEAHHLVHVLRIREDDVVVLFDGKGRACRARVRTIAGPKVTLEPVAPEPSRESALSLSIAVSPPKGDRMSDVVRKLTELGVARVIPLLTTRGELDSEHCRRNLDRWRRVATEAAKQCGRSLLPDVEAPRDVSELLRARDGLGPGAALMADPGAGPLALTLAPSPAAAPRRILVLVGPEGGWSESELSLADAEEWTRFALGPRTLRVETAAVAAAAIVQYLAGDLSS